LARFKGLNVQVLGISVDHEPCLVAWADSLGGISYPLLSDFWPHGEVARKYGVLLEEFGKTERAIFIIDEQGILRYIDIHDIDDQPSNEVLFAELEKINPQGAKAWEETGAPEPQELSSGGVVMYCNSWCPDCRKARAWLKEHNIEFTDVDIPTTAGAADQVRKWADGNLVTPTFDIDGTIIIDFDKETLAGVLKTG
jgi:glutaredoxin